MSEISRAQFVPPNVEDLSVFTVSELVGSSVTDFDLYLKATGQFVLYAASPYLWQYDEIERLLKQGQAALYYFTKEQQKVEAYKKIKALPKIDMSKPPSKRIVDLTEVGMELTRILYDYPITQASMAKVEHVAQGMVSTITEDVSCVSALGLLANHDYYTYYHSARVAAYAVALASQMSLNEAVKLNEIAVGCLLHDIGKSKVGLEILNKPGQLSNIEFDEMKKHPEYGDSLVSQSLLSVVPRGIILHHHERLTGDGYPHRLTKHEILQEVRIASFADVFDALTTNRPYQVSRTKFEALDLIKAKLLEAVDKDVFKAMVQILEHQKKA